MPSVLLYLMSCFLTPVIWGAGSAKAVRGLDFLVFRA